MNFSDSVTVEAPADVLWEVVKDLPSLPQVVTSVAGFEWVSSSNTSPLQVGARFRETRMHDNRPFIMFKTVTALQETGPERSLSLGISVQNPDGSRNDTVNTSTLIVQPVNEETSRLILTGAFKSGKCMTLVNYYCCYPCIRRLVRTSVEQELDDYRDAAVELYEKMQSQGTTEKNEDDSD